MKRFFTLFALILGASPLFSQQLNDYRSSAAGPVDVTMESIAGWQRWNGSAWVNATTAPDDFNFADGNTITIETGDIWEMTSDVNFTSDNDFNIVVRGGISNPVGGTYDFDYGSGNTTVTIVRATNPNFDGWFQDHSFANLVLEGNGSNSFTFGGTGLTINNSLTLTNVNLNVSDFNLNNDNASIQASGNITITGDQTILNSVLNITFEGNNRTLSIGNNPDNDDFTMAGASGSTLNVTFNGSGGTMIITSVDTDLTNSIINLNGDGAIINQIGDNDGGGGGTNELNLITSSINLNGPNQTFNVAGDINLNNTSFFTLPGANGLLALTSTNITGAGTNAYIQLGSTSTASRQINQGANFLFPIGTTANYLPVTITSANNGGNRAFTAGVFENATTNAQPGGPSAWTPPIVNAVWNVQTSGTTNKSVSLQFGWQNATEGTLFNSLPNNNIGFSQYDNSANLWPLAAAGSTASNTTNSLTTANLTLSNTQANSFAISQIGVTLPVLTRNFTATPFNGQVKLDWIASATHMNSYFEVERSNNGKDNFRKIATIQVKAIGEEKYSYFDTNPLKPEGFYRIRVIDENLRVTRTKTLKVNFGGAHFSLDNLFPTLATSHLNLLISSSKAQQTRVEIVDQSGRIAVAQNLTVNSGSQSYQLNVTSLSKGFYILRLRNGEEVVSSRFLKQ